MMTNPLILDTRSHVSAKEVCIALDFSNKADTLAFVSQLDPNACRLKVGKELFTATGPSLVEALSMQGFDVFLDLKFHDIPNTVKHACQMAAQLGVWMVNVHASGGRRMMEEAANGLANLSQRPLLIGVTVLTSMEQSDLAEIGLDIEPIVQVQRLATLAQHSGLDGVVCSAQEAKILKQAHGENFKLITPGIRLSDSAADDQRRVMTPVAALKNGADFLVIGRPITQSKDPMMTLAQINQDIQTYKMSLMQS